MTEIPEHLLKRSKERRSAIGGGGGGDDAPAADAPAAASAAPAESSAPVPAAAAATPAPVEEAPKPVPVRPEVAAYQRRKRIPFWAMPVLLGLPIWAYVYQGTLEPPPADASTPFASGQSLYGSCQGCHGAGGDGGAGIPALTDVLENFPDYRDHMMWVRLGSSGWPADTYGATDQSVDGGMPGFNTWTDAELAQVVLYERAAFGGLEEGSEEYLELEAIATGEMTFAEAGLGEDSAESGVPESELGG